MKMRWLNLAFLVAVVALGIVSDGVVSAGVPGGMATRPAAAQTLATNAAAVPYTAGTYIVGADISSVQAAEDRGTKFKDGGVEKDILAILKDHGFNYVRLRVFVDPTKATPRDRPYSAAGYCDVAHTVAMAKRVKAAGMGLLIDFHYSDSWADPGKQFTPSAWKDLSADDLVAKLHDWTKDAVKQMKEAGGEPDMVQVGNEITPGMMNDIPAGGSTRNWKQLGALLKGGISAVKEVDPKILVMLHIDKGGDNAVTRRWVDAEALEQGVEFDVLGESCYTRWQGPPEKWKANFADLAVRYPKLKFMVAEVAYEVKEADEIMRGMPEGKGMGTFVWEPTQNGNMQGLFDRMGNVLPEKMGAYDAMRRGSQK